MMKRALDNVIFGKIVAETQENCTYLQKCLHKRKTFQTFRMI